MVFRLRQFTDDQCGSTMLEFSLIAMPLIIFLFATVDMGLWYWASKEMEQATSYGARLIRTGDAKNRNLDAIGLRNEICSQVAILTNCGSALRVDARSRLTFDAFPAITPTGADGQLKQDADFSYDIGSRNSVVLLTTFYSWNGLLGNGRILRAAAAIRNEPF